MKKILWGKIVFQIEQKAGKSLEDMLMEFHSKQMTYREQAAVLGVSYQHIMLWRRKLGLKANSVKKANKDKLNKEFIKQKYNLNI